MEQKVIKVKIEGNDDPDCKLTTELGQLIEDNSKEPLLLEVNAVNCGYFYHIDRMAKTLVWLRKPHWKLVLWIGSDHLESVPESVWEIANLEQLGLDGNNLKTLSPAIAKLTKLKKLFIAYNPFEGFPEAVCQLEQLESLSAAHCRLSSLPSSLENWMWLKMLLLGNNKLSSLPPSFANLQTLKYLEISSNHFKEFPTVVCELPNLRHLIADGNQLKELPLTMTKLVSLDTLDLSRNSFASFPLFLGELLQLSAFYSSGTGNPLQGPQRSLESADLFSYLKEQCVILRLVTLVASGFYCEQHIDWARFLFQGVYDPRLFLFIADFLGLLEEETCRKKFRSE